MNIKLAYVHAMSFPSKEANASDAIWTASALAKRVDTTFFMPRLAISKSKLKAYYGIADTPLHLRTLHLDLVPDRILLSVNDVYERLLGFVLCNDFGWKQHKGDKVLYVRHPRHLMYWGLAREKQGWLNDWILCYESHDPLGLDPNKFGGMNPFQVEDVEERNTYQNLLRAANNFDLIICNTQSLATDLQEWSDGQLQPHFLPISSPLPRVANPPNISFGGDEIRMGYFGTIDQYRGVHILIDALRYLPDNFKLRLVGRFRQEQGVDPAWFETALQDPQIGPKISMAGYLPITEVMKEIDCCDLVIQPASNDINDSRYATPQKSFDYMMRGKPIVAGNVHSHRTLFQDGKSAALYNLTPGDLAKGVLDLVQQPHHAQEIARAAWEQARSYTLDQRAENILNLLRLRQRANHS